jgi:hypothetical protein
LSRERSFCFGAEKMSKEVDVSDDTAKSGLLVVRLPQELIEQIDRSAGRELLSRSAHVRRTLNAVYARPAAVV